MDLPRSWAFLSSSVLHHESRVGEPLPAALGLSTGWQDSVAPASSGRSGPEGAPRDQKYMLGLQGGVRVGWVCAD